MTKLKRYELFGIGIIAILSLLMGLLFLNNPTGVPFLEYIMPASTSLWDVSKILFVSLFLYAIFEYFVFGKKYPNFIFSKGIALIFAPLLFIFFTYSMDMIIGDVYMFVHALTFITAIVFAQVMSYYFMQEELYFKLMNVLGAFLILFGFLALTSYTINPTLLPIFDPMNEYTEIITK